jgi:hypothetical protein
MDEGDCSRLFMFKKILSLLLVAILCLSLFPAIPASAASTLLTFQYTGSDAASANVKFKKILGTWHVAPDDEVDVVTGNLDITTSSTTDIMGAYISSVAEGYTLSGWNITIGENTTTYNRSDGHVFADDYTFALWYGNPADLSNWLYPIPKTVGGVMFSYDPGANIVVEPIFETESQGYEITVESADLAQGAVSKDNSSSIDSNTWILTASPAPGYMLDYWVWKTDSQSEYPTDGTQKIENDSTNSKAIITETVSENRSYKAFFKTYGLVLVPNTARITTDKTNWDSPHSGDYRSTFSSFPLPVNEIVQEGKPSMLYFQYTTAADMLRFSTVDIKIYKGNSTGTNDLIASAIVANNAFHWSTVGIGRVLAMYIAQTPYPLTGFTARVELAGGLVTTQYYELDSGWVLSDALATARANALNSLATELSDCQANPGYSAVAVFITEAYNAGVAAINAAETVEAITAARLTAKTAMNSWLSGGAGINVTISVEKRTVPGGGDVVTPATVTLPAGCTAGQALEYAILQKYPGVTPIHNGTSGAGYVAGVYDPTYSGNLAYSASYAAHPGYLSEFNEGNGSGWMFSVTRGGKTSFVQTSAYGYTLEAGDVLRWQYTLNLGSDLGAGLDEEDDDDDAIDPDLAANVDTVRVNVLNKLKTDITNPVVNSQRGEWAVFAMARGGVLTETAKNAYLANLKGVLQTKGAGGAVKLNDAHGTDNARVIIALASLGIDATDFEGYDLVSPLFDVNYAKYLGPNGTAFALLALNTKPYDSAEANAAKTALVAELLNSQHNDGGWAAGAVTAASNIDYTAMALQALAPYYADNKTKIDNAVTWLLSAKPGTSDKPESNAQRLVALATLKAVGAFATSVKDVLENDLEEIGNKAINDGTGGVKHANVSGYNDIATEQSAYALVAYNRYKTGATPLYDMSDLTFNTVTPVGGSDTITSDSGTVTADEITAAVAEATKSGGSNVVTIETTSDAVTLPAESIAAIANGGAKLTIKSADAELTFSGAALTAISGTGNLVITAQSKNTPPTITNATGLQAVELTVTVGGTSVTQFGGGVIVKVPYTLPNGKTASQVTVWYIPTSGDPEKVSGATYANGYVTFTTTHFSEYAVGIDESVKITVGSASGLPGGTVKVPVSIVNNPGFWGYNLTLDVPAGLTLTALEKGDFDGTFIPNVSGKVAFLNNEIPGANSGTSMTDFTGDGVLFYATFAIDENASLGATYNISVGLTAGDATNFVNLAEESVGFTAESGTIQASKTTPAIGDISHNLPLTVTYDTTAKSATVTKANDAIGGITVYYVGTDGTTYNKSTDAPTNAGKYAVSVEIAENSAYAAAAFDLGTLTINKQTLTITWPTVANTYTLGTKLSEIPLTGGSTNYGSFAWADGDTEVGDTNANYMVTFTPTSPYDNGNYDYPNSGSVLVPTGTKGTPDLDDLTITFPTGDDLIYSGNPVSVSVTGKSDGLGQITVYYEGVNPTSYTKSTTPPTNAGTYKVIVKIAESDAFEAATIELAEHLVIAKKQISIDWPTINEKITSGTKLSDITLPASQYGTFEWTAPDVEVTESGNYGVTFTPSESYPETNYDFGTKTHNVYLTVKGDRLKGDGDNDGHITMADIQLLAKLAAGLNPTQSNGAALTQADKDALDMNDDGVITTLDLLLLAKKFVGLE